MAKKAKAKEPELVRQKKKYRKIQYTLFGSQFISILTPYIVLGGVYFDEWFVQNPDGWKIGIGGMMGMAMAGLAYTVVIKNKDKANNWTNGYLTLLLTWTMTAVILFMLSSIIEELAFVMLCGSAGLAGGLGLDIGSKKVKEKADAYQKVIDELGMEKLKKDYIEEARKLAGETAEAEKERPTE